MSLDDMVRKMVAEVVDGVKAQLKGEVRAEVLAELHDAAPSTDPERWLSLKEAVEYCGLEGDTAIRDAAKKGTLKHGRVNGKNLRFKRYDLDAWLKACAPAKVAPVDDKEARMKRSRDRILGG